MFEKDQTQGIRNWSLGLPRTSSVIAGLLLGVFGACGANVSLSVSDASGTSSFNSSGNWNSGAAPSITNSYATTNFTLRSPADTAAYTFGGGSLRIDAGGRFLMKGVGGQS